MSLSKRCEVCGGQVKTLDDESGFGYCARCGLVYAVSKLSEDQNDEEPRLGPETERKEDRQGGGPPAGSDEPVEAGSRWRCPDCGESLAAGSEEDLKFVIREHTREYHPNRAAGQVGS